MTIKKFLMFCFLTFGQIKSVDLPDVNQILAENEQKISQSKQNFNTPKKQVKKKQGSVYESPSYKNYNSDGDFAR